MTGVPSTIASTKFLPHASPLVCPLANELTAWWPMCPAYLSFSISFCTESEQGARALLREGQTDSSAAAIKILIESDTDGLSISTENAADSK